MRMGFRITRRPCIISASSNIEINLKGLGCEGIDLIQLVLGRVQWRKRANTVM
jgi:hypothetical protein